MTSERETDQLEAAIRSAQAFFLIADPVFRDDVMWNDAAKDEIRKVGTAARADAEAQLTEARRVLALMRSALVELKGLTLPIRNNAEAMIRRAEFEFETVDAALADPSEQVK